MDRHSLGNTSKVVSWSDKPSVCFCLYVPWSPRSNRESFYLSPVSQGCPWQGCGCTCAGWPADGQQCKAAFTGAFAFCLLHWALTLHTSFSKLTHSVHGHTTSSHNGRRGKDVLKGKDYLFKNGDNTWQYKILWWNGRTSMIPWDGKVRFWMGPFSSQAMAGVCVSMHIAVEVCMFTCTLTINELEIRMEQFI